MFHFTQFHLNDDGSGSARLDWPGNTVILFASLGHLERLLDHYENQHGEAKDANPITEEQRNSTGGRNTDNRVTLPRWPGQVKF